MAQNTGEYKNNLVDKVISLADERRDAASKAAAMRFLHAYYGNVAAEDIVGLAPQALFARAMALFDFASRRPHGQAAIRVYRPHADKDGWEGEHWVVELVNDDMPFLVDSVTAALQQLGLSVHLLVHPILAVSRDASGLLTDIPGEGEGTGRESFMHIEIDRLPDKGVEAVLVQLEGALADVRAAVEDWQAMRAGVAAALADLRGAEGTVGAEELAEGREFLAWCGDDHFTFLGYRRYSFAVEDGEVAIAIDPTGGLGVLRDPSLRVFDDSRDLAAIPAELRATLIRPNLLFLTKADRPATVHRPEPMDIVGVKRFDATGRVIGMHTFVGLYAAAVYTLSPSLIPVLRLKIARVMTRAGFAADSHDGRALRAIIENFPRDELLQASEDMLFDTALAILRLNERRRVALFVRKDEFERFVAIQVFVPRDRYDTRLRISIQEELAHTYNGTIAAWYAQIADSPLARLSFIVRMGDGRIPDVDTVKLEARLVELARSWADRLQEVLIEAHGEERGLVLFRRWARSFPASYIETAGAGQALEDIDRIEAAGGGIALKLYRPAEAPPGEARFKIYRAGDPVPLSDVLPLFEHMGFRVISEEPHCLKREGDTPFMVHDFRIAAANRETIDDDALSGRVEEAFLACWKGEAEDDGFNRLVVKAGLTWRQVSVLRAYSKYLRQAGSTFSQSYVENSVASNDGVAALLLRLFETRFDPTMPSDAPEILATIDKALEAVANADEDRILRRFLDLLLCTLRTNYFQRGPDGKPKPHLSLKLDSRRVQGLPLPRPMVEIFVYSPATEGIHLRGGKVARGGIRWSDRPEDFRTEVLGLMKAQMVKNAVIVPVGSKGGFVVKRANPSASREAQLEEGIACYKTLISGLLDITDNLVGGQVVPPPDTARRDGDDPYLVVAADKGTATFSDIANGVSQAYGFWLGDAFASGGSQGYDHKIMGITAKGAWESVKRHFRELGRDIASEPFTVVGVGDMSGDVFGNGLLRSRATKLVAAFDHRHIFLDPDPDPLASYDERARLFALPRSSWADYDATLISPGGGVFARNAKVIHLSPQIQARFGIEMDIMTPVELIRRLLLAEVDLLWFGGIGTYVKAAAESNTDVGDRANEGLRVNGRDLCCKVVGEGANLAMTQAGRIEYALAGGRLNTDAIDNSAGVDCSDHEVNIKILLNGAVGDGGLPLAGRNALLAEMTNEVASLVLRDNYLQSQAISVFESQAAAMLDQQDRFMRLLERSGRLDRAVEFLPTDDDLARRANTGRGLTRPEIAVLLAYGKLWLYDAILDSDLPDDPLLIDELVRYFPSALNQPLWRERMANHRLRREIVATAATNSMVNRVGGSIVARVMEATGATAAEVARAYLIVRDSFGLRDVWDAIEALDQKVAARVQTAMLAECNRLIGRGVTWVLGHAHRPLDIGRLRAELEPGVVGLKSVLNVILPADVATQVATRAEDYRAQGVPEALAQKVASLIVLASANDISSIARNGNRSVEDVGHIYFLVGARFGLGWLRASAERLAGATHWQRLAIDAVIDELYVRQAALTASVAAFGGDAEESLTAWIDERSTAVDRAAQLLGELKAAGTLDLASLVVASHQFAGLGEK